VRCSSCEPLLDGYLEGALRAREARAVAAHLQACDSCSSLLQELRVIDALLTTARRARVGPDFTATVVSAAKTTQPHPRRRVPVGAALLLYTALAWIAGAMVALRSPALSGAASSFVSVQQHGLAALAAAARALGPATGVLVAAVTGILLLDVLLLSAIVYRYRQIRQPVALRFDRETNV
jgi:anti-sigma factor RsiW